MSACFAGAHAQAWFEEDFEQVPVEGQTGSLPQGWVLYNDGNRPASQFSYCTEAWNIRVVDNNKIAVSPSWFANTSARADRWMITPPVALPEGSDAVLAFDARSFDAGERETYLVLASAGSTGKEAFTDTLLQVKGEDGSWRTRAVSLEKYAGKAVHIAFVQRSLDRYALYVDNVKISNLEKPSVALSSLLVPSTVAPGETFSVSADARLVLDEEAASYQIGYRLQDGSGEIVQGAVSGQAEPATSVAGEDGQGRELLLCQFKAEAAGLQISRPGSFRIEAWIESVNGRETVSDTLQGMVEVTQQGFFKRNTLLEVYSSSTSGSCPAANAAIDEAFAMYRASCGDSTVFLVKYQMDFPAPGDPCVINEGLYRGEFYGVNAIPSLFVNGTKRKVEWSGFPSSLPGIAETEANRKTPFGLQASMSREGNAFRVEVEVASVTAYPEALLYVVFTEDSLWHEPQSNGETEFFHVARKVLPDAYGQEIGMETSGTARYGFEYVFDGTSPEIFSSLDGLSAVVFVQDGLTGEILQSAFLPAMPSEEAGNGALERPGPGLEVEACPNPCRDHCTLNVRLPFAGEAFLEVFDLRGNRLWSCRDSYPAEGARSFEIPVERWEKGVYVLKVQAGETVVTKKIVLC